MGRKEAVESVKLILEELRRLKEREGELMEKLRDLCRRHKLSVDLEKYELIDDEQIS